MFALQNGVDEESQTTAIYGGQNFKIYKYCFVSVVSFWTQKYHPLLQLSNFPVCPCPLTRVDVQQYV